MRKETTLVRQVPNEFPQFYLTAPAACPYLDGQYEKKIFTHLMGEEADQLNNMLTQAGFRRSQGIAYRPACEDCKACVSVRILAGAFSPSKNHKRVLKRNADILSKEVPATGTNEQFSLLRTYLDARHADGGMADMTTLDYAAMVEDTNVNTVLVEYRLPLEPGAFTKQGRLIGLALTDQMEDGLSMVYSFFDPEFKDRSLGTYLILDHIMRTQKRTQPHLYLGYWVDGCQKMSYKARFQPIEALGPEGWKVLPPPPKSPTKSSAK